MAIAKASEYDYMVKLLIVGDSGVGKTNMLLKFCENCFHESHLSTIGKLRFVNIFKELTLN
jgi:GTPase SAR1 family protein